MNADRADGLLVVAGEPSGDALAADVVARLGRPSFGLGGPRLARAGTDVLVDLRSFAAMGVAPVLLRAPRLFGASRSVARAVALRRPRAALLVGFSEMNARLAPRLKQRGTRVLWYAPPQVWAWRPGRAPRIAAVVDRLAVVLPFETRTWQAAGAVVDYVGHPAARAAWLDTPANGAPTVALLPGSRSHEVRSHLPPLLDAARRLAGGGVRARLVLAEALDGHVAERAIRDARRAGVGTTRAPLPEALSGASAAIVASGTATLECAAHGVPPVIVYRTDPLTFGVARRLVRVPHIGLPNLTLGERAFPELLQGDAHGAAIAHATFAVLEARDAHLGRCRDVRDALGRSLDDRSPADRVAAMIDAWLG
jgi:lipid-A-disaccharide synthase